MGCCSITVLNSICFESSYSLYTTIDSRCLRIHVDYHRNIGREQCFHFNKFKDAGFERIIFTVHPYGLPNEIPGKCSNSNYGLRMVVSQMNVADDDMKNILVTTCDADSKCPPDYIAALTWKYLQENQPILKHVK
ncbi:unnamed protein product [Rotaria sordida]|uniref:Uncharacterized protein n=1 Tax=Rotaria sordida TaxID=392033 RepID=A0A813UU88_9BILA|nr:unnamed protein product [Rotaria sordida]